MADAVGTPQSAVLTDEDGIALDYGTADPDGTENAPIVRPIEETKAQRYARLGYAYGTTTSLLAVAGTAETDFMLLRNPAASGKAVCFLDGLFASEVQSKNEGCFFRVYFGPTITANGTDLTISRIRPGIGAASVCSAYRGPTITARGTLACVISTYACGMFRDACDLFRFLDAGIDLLVTATPGSSGLICAAGFSWVEI